MTKLFQTDLFFFIISLLILFSFSARADEQINQLKADIQLCQNDSLRVDKIIQLVNVLYNSDPQLAETYIKEALRISQKINYTKGKAFAKFQLCRVYSDYEFGFAESLALQSLKLAEQIDDSILMAKVFNILGNLKDNMNEGESSSFYYKKSLGIFQRHHENKLIASIYNNLGVCYTGEHGDSISRGYLLKAIEINIQNNNLQWLAINYTNLGYEHIMIDQLEEGKSYLLLSLDLCTEKKYIRILPYVNNNLGLYYLKKGDYKKAIDYSLSALKSSREQSNSLQEKDALAQLSNAYFELYDIKKAFKYLKQVNAINDTINKHGRLKEIDLLEMRYKFEEELKEKELEKALAEKEHYKRESTYLFIILIAIVIIVVFFFLYSYQRNRAYQKTLDHKNTLLEKEKLSKDLDYKNKELTTNVIYLLKKNELISTISNRLKKIHDEKTVDLSIAINRIVADLNQSISNDSWEEFEIRFQEVHIGFYKRLDNKFPNLSPNELRLSAFLRLNMTTKEIANITFQSPNSIKIARYRLRKKLDVKKGENLISVLSKI